MGFGNFLGGIPVFGGVAKGAYDAVGGVASDIGDLPGDYMSAGTNRYREPGYSQNPGLEQGAAAGQAANQGYQDQAFQGFQQGYGLSPQQTADQTQALGLMRNAAMGNAPSVAAIQQQQGLNQALANQTSLAGSARGGAGIALAGANSGGNAAAMQQNAFVQAGMLRAQEMAQARGDYGQMGNALRGQDIQNAGNDIQYRLGAGNVANAYGQTGLGYMAQRNQLEGQRADMYNAQQDRASGIMGANAQNKLQNRNKIIDMGTGLGKTIGGMAGG